MSSSSNMSSQHMAKSNANVSSSYHASKDEYAASSALPATTLREDLHLSSSSGLATAAVPATETAQWHSETSTLTTTSTSLPPASAPLPPTLNEEITKQYTAYHSTDSLKELISKMEKIQMEIDMYAKAQQDLVSKESIALINECMQRSKFTQDALTKDVHTRTQLLDEKYGKRREELLKALDVEKAAEFANLQTQFLQRQEEIQMLARKQVDEITEAAKQKKLAIVNEAQHKHTEISQNLNSSVTTFDSSSSKLNEFAATQTSLKSDLAHSGVAAAEPRADVQRRL